MGSGGTSVRSGGSAVPSPSKHRLALPGGPRLWASAALLAIAVSAALLAAYLHIRGQTPGAGVAAAAAAVASLAAAALTAPRIVVWARWRHRAARWKAPLTSQGAIFIMFLLLTGGSAVYSGNNLLYLTLSAMLAAMLMSGLASKLCLAALELRLALPDHIFAGQPALARITLRNLKRWIPSFAILLDSGDAREGGMRLEPLYFPAVAPRGAAAASVEAMFPRRGVFRHEVIRLRTRFPFGFVERETKLRLSEEIVVFPSIELEARAQEVLRRFETGAPWRAAGDSHDLYRIRPAEPGDNARFLHWKSAARSGGLWVREFARDDRLRVVLTLDRRTAPDAQILFEDEVEACAAVAWRLHQMRADVTVRSDEVSIVCQRESGEIFAALRYLALVQAAPPDGPAPPASRDEDAAEARFGGLALEEAREPFW